MDMNEKIEQYKVLKNKIDGLNAELETIKADIITDMNGENEVKTDKYTVRYTLVSTNRFDTNNFKKNQPDLYAEYTKTTESKRFSIV